MSVATEPVTLTFPRFAVDGVVALSESLTDKMHALLERNTDGALSPDERAELETLVQIAQFGQLISAAAKATGRP